MVVVMAISVGMHEAKTNLSRLVHAAQAGEEVVLTRRGKPVAKLEPVHGSRQKGMDAFLAMTESIHAGSGPGGRSWTRDELYER
jgi:prevent-host-death family protein